MAQGFVLLELVVTIVIISILAGLVLTSLPAYRQRQALILSEQQLASVFREASERALNEQRDQACLDQTDADTFCSNVGLHLQGQTITMFADMNGNQSYDPHGDYLIREDQLPTGTQFNTDNQTFVFEATPPSIKLFGPQVLAIKTGTIVTQFTVNNYGIITRQ